MIAEASLECQKEYRPATSCGFLVRSTEALCQPFVSFDWTNAKGVGMGDLKVSVKMTHMGTKSIFN